MVNLQGGRSAYIWSATYELSVGICEMAVLQGG